MSWHKAAHDESSIMSDIGGIFSPFDLALIALMIAAPGLVAGGVIGTLVWRARRIAGARRGGRRRRVAAAVAPGPGHVLGRRHRAQRCSSVKKYS